MNETYLLQLTGTFVTACTAVLVIWVLILMAGAGRVWHWVREIHREAQAARRTLEAIEVRLAQCPPDRRATPAERNT